MNVDANPLVLVLQNATKRIKLEIYDDEDNPVDASELTLQVQTLGGQTVLMDSFTTPPPGGTRIVRTDVGKYYIRWGDRAAAVNVPTQTETRTLQRYLFSWEVVGPNGTDEEQRVQTIDVISAFMLDRIRAFREQIDKSRKAVSVEPTDFCPLGYTDGMLLEYLRGGMTIINSYQPYPTWCSVESFPDRFLQNLFDAALIVGVNAQTLYAVDSDIEQWCFVSDTPVTLADGSRRPIQCINVGDRVLDRLGNTQTVEAAWCEGQPDELVEIELWGKRKFTCTPQHAWPAWSWVRTCRCHCGEPVKPGKLFKLGHHTRVAPLEMIHVRGGKGNTPTRQCVPADYEPRQRLRADELRVGDFLLVPRRFAPIETDVTSDEARLLGYYAAEGCPIYSRAKDAEDQWANLSFSFAEDEVDTWIADIEAIAQRGGFVVERGLSSYAASVDLRTVSNFDRCPKIKRLVDLARRHVGNGALTKSLSPEVMRWPLELKREFVRGALRGDGYQSWCVTNKSGRPERAFGVGYSTSSPTLCAQLQLILAQLGFPTRLVINKERESQRASRRRRDNTRIRGKKNYVLRIPPPYAFDLADLVWGEDSLSDLFTHGREGWAMPRPECMIDEEFIYIPIKRITRVANKSPVFNLTISGDHSYMVQDVATYNSDQGNAFVINHQPKLAAFSAALAQRLDKLIPSMKLHFVSSGSVKIEAGPSFRINALVQMSPNGALFRNAFLR